MEDLIKEVFNKIVCIILPVIGGAVFVGLLSRYRFRKEFKRKEDSLTSIQNLYNTLCWNKYNPCGDTAVCSYEYAGQFCWDDLRGWVKFSLFSYGTKDKEALRRFLKFENSFVDMGDIFEIPVDEAIKKVENLAINHFYCMEVMYNFGKFGTNNDESKELKRFPFISNTSEAFKLYQKKYDKGTNLEDHSHLMDLLKKCEKPLE